MSRLTLHTLTNSENIHQSLLTLVTGLALSYLWNLWNTIKISLSKVSNLNFWKQGWKFWKMQEMNKFRICKLQLAKANRNLMKNMDFKSKISYCHSSLSVWGKSKRTISMIKRATGIDAHTWFSYWVSTRTGMKNGKKNRNIACLKQRRHWQPYLKAKSLNLETHFVKIKRIQCPSCKLKNWNLICLSNQ